MMHSRRDLLFAMAGSASPRRLRSEWREILGKLEPNRTDRRWFVDRMVARELGSIDRGAYIRHHIELPLEVDFWQPGLLLVPKGIKRGERRPTVIA